MRKILWLDLETTDSKTDRGGGIHQISYIIDIDGIVVESKEFKVKPFKNDLINHESITFCGKTFEEINNYPPPQEAFRVMVNDVHKYRKMVIGGYNNAIFDNPLFQAWWYKCSQELRRYDLKFSEYFHYDALDVRVMAVDDLLDTRDDMKSFKLGEIGKHYGLDVDESGLHDALYDVQLTKDIYYKIKEVKKWNV